MVLLFLGRNDEINASEMTKNSTKNKWLNGYQCKNTTSSEALTFSRVNFTPNLPLGVGWREFVAEILSDILPPVDIIKNGFIFQLRRHSISESEQFPSIEHIYHSLKANEKVCTFEYHSYKDRFDDPIRPTALELLALFVVFLIVFCAFCAFVESSVFILLYYCQFVSFNLCLVSFCYFFLMDLAISIYLFDCSRRLRSPGITFNEFEYYSGIIVAHKLYGIAILACNLFFVFYFVCSYMS